MFEGIQSGQAPVWATWPYRLARRRWRIAAALVAAAAATVVLFNVGGLGNRLARRDAGSIKLAVLPFENLTGDPAQDFFSDGLTDDMITRLGRLQPARLRVIGRSSSMHYKDHAAPVDAMARDLGVVYVLEGTLGEMGRGFGSTRR